MDQALAILEASIAEVEAEFGYPARLTAEPAARSTDIPAGRLCPPDRGDHQSSKWTANLSALIRKLTRCWRSNRSWMSRSALPGSSAW